MSEEFVLADLQDARAALEEISGRRAPRSARAHLLALLRRKMRQAVST